MIDFCVEVFHRKSICRNEFSSGIMGLEIVMIRTERHPSVFEAFASWGISSIDLRENITVEVAIEIVEFSNADPFSGSFQLGDTKGLRAEILIRVARSVK